MMPLIIKIPTAMVQTQIGTTGTMLKSPPGAKPPLRVNTVKSFTTLSATMRKPTQMIHRGKTRALIAETEAAPNNTANGTPIRAKPILFMSESDWAIPNGVKFRSVGAVSRI